MRHSHAQLKLLRIQFDRRRRRQNFHHAVGRLSIVGFERNLRNSFSDNLQVASGIDRNNAGVARREISHALGICLGVVIIGIRPVVDLCIKMRRHIQPKFQTVFAEHNANGSRINANTALRGLAIFGSYRNR